MIQYVLLPIKISWPGHDRSTLKDYRLCVRLCEITELCKTGVRVADRDLPGGPKKTVPQF